MKRLHPKPVRPKGRLDHVDRAFHELDVLIWKLLKLVPDERRDEAREVLDSCARAEASWFLQDDDAPGEAKS